MKRRHLLKLSGAIITAVSGCVGQGPSANTTPPTGSPTQKTQTDPTEYCTEQYDRFTPSIIIKDPPVGGFELITSADSVPVGGELTVRLRNVTSEQKITGVRGKYLVERRTDQGWESIFWRRTSTNEGETATDEWNAAGKTHAPDEGHSWQLAATREGFARHTIYRVCTEITPGTYRFVYWGVASENESGSPGEDAIATLFTVTGD